MACFEMHEAASGVMSESSDKNFERYHRQMLLPGVGRAGQERLRSSHALLVGCGALGTVIADALVRAGIGEITIVDRDVVEVTNLQRQILFDEEDVKAVRPKAVAARDRLSRINSDVKINAHAEDFTARNAERFVEGADIILDGLDNFETRYLLNDLAVKHSLPYIYGGAVGTTGMSMAVTPTADFRRAATDAESPSHPLAPSPAHGLPCLRCIFPEAPPPGISPTCDTAGVLGPAVLVVAAYQAAQAIKLLTGNVDALDRSLLSIDLWSNELRRFDVSGARNPDCPCCGLGRFEFIERRSSGGAAALCGRNAVQVTPPERGSASNGLDLHLLAERLSAHGRFTHDESLLKGVFKTERGATGEPIELLLFRDGRAIVRGTDAPELARSIYARYIGR